MNRFSPILLVITLVLLPGSLAAQVSWPMYQANAAHTGYIPVSFDPQDFSLKWEVTLSGSLQRVVAVDGRVFASLWSASDIGNELFALDADDGTILWSWESGDVSSVGAPAYDSGKVFVQVGMGYDESVSHLYVYDAQHGALLNDESYPSQWQRYNAPTIVGGTAYISGGYHGGVYAYSFEMEPYQRWFNELDNDGMEWWTPAVDGVFAYATTDDHLVVIRCSDGVDSFRIQHPGVTSNSLGHINATVLGGHNDILVIHGTSFASFDLGTRSMRFDISSETEIFSGDLAVSKGVAFINNLGNLEARNQDTGVLLWSWIPPGDYRLLDSIVLTDQHVLVYTMDGLWGLGERGAAVHAIDLNTHQSVWSYQVGPVGWEPPIRGYLTWSEGVLYISRGDGVLTALGLSEYQQSSIVHLISATSSIAEDAGNVPITVQRGGSAEGAVSVTLRTDDGAGSATAGADYTTLNQVVNWAEGDVTDKTVNLVIHDDPEIEGPETVHLVLENLTGPSTLAVPSRAVVDIIDDEIDVLRLSSGGTDVGESDGSVSLSVLREGPATGAVTVNYATANGTASAGSDFTADSDMLSWADGDSTSKTIELSILDDGVDEDNETFTVSLSTPTGNAIVGSPSVFTVTVVDDDGPRVQFSASSYQVDETGGSVDLTVTRSGSTDGAVSVDWATGGGSASPGQDYVAGSGTFDWADLDGEDKTITITVLDDTATEGGESFQVTLSNPVGDNISLGQPGVATVSIVDDESLEARINTTVLLGQMRPRIAMDGLGSAVVVWDSYKQDGYWWGVFGQRLDADGGPVGSEFQVNETTDEDQMNAAVAAAADGSFVVVWQGDIVGGTEIYARRYNVSGVPLGGEFVVNSSASGNQTVPRVTFDGNGRSMVVWQGRDASGPGVFARVFSAAGVPLADEFAVNTTTPESQGFPDVAGSSAGGFVVVWESYTQDDGLSDGVIGRRFESTGVAVGGEIMVNELVAGNQELPAVAVAGEGRFIVVWEDDAGLDGALGSIRGRWFDDTGSPVWGGFQINTYGAGDQGRPAVMAEPNGRAVVVWEGRNGQDGSEIGVFERALYDDDTFATGEIQLNTYTGESQYQPAVACSSAGEFLGVWTSEGQDGSFEGVYGVSWPLPPTRLIFTDGFESGDTSAW